LLLVPGPRAPAELDDSCSPTDLSDITPVHLKLSRNSLEPPPAVKVAQQERKLNFFLDFGKVKLFPENCDEF